MRMIRLRRRQQQQHEEANVVAVATEDDSTLMNTRYDCDNNNYDDGDTDDDDDNNNHSTCSQSNNATNTTAIQNDSLCYNNNNFKMRNKSDDGNNDNNQNYDSNGNYYNNVWFCFFRRHYSRHLKGQVDRKSKHPGGIRHSRRIIQKSCSCLLIFSAIGMLANYFRNTSTNSHYFDYLKNETLQQYYFNKFSSFNYYETAFQTYNHENKSSSGCHDVDDMYDGIYHISMTDIEGGVGTSLIQLVILQIYYAELHHLKPWVYLTNQYTPNHINNHVIYDPFIHISTNTTIQFPVSDIITNVTQLRYQNSNQPPMGRHHQDVVWPGKPLYNEDNSYSNRSSPLYYTVNGTNGIWDSYFYPVSDFTPQNNKNEMKECYRNKPIVSISDIYLVTPGLHGYSPYSIRVWRYKYLPEYISKQHLSFSTWIYPQRVRAYTIVQKYIHFRPYLLRQAYIALLNSSTADANASNHDDDYYYDTTNVTFSMNDNNYDGSNIIDYCHTVMICLGLHIRHSDKAAGRRIISVSEFYPYVEMFVNATTKVPKNAGSLKQNDQRQRRPLIYIATDSTQVLNEIQSTWSKEIQSLIRYSPSMIRSDNTTAVFDLHSMNTNSSSSDHHHRTNQEAMIDIIALSNCTFLIHGYSAISESAIWMSSNLRLHSNSINLEDTDYNDHHIMNTSIFYQMIRNEINNRNYNSDVATTTFNNEQQEDEGKKLIQQLPKPIRGIDHWPDGEILIHDNAPNLLHDPNLLLASSLFNDSDNISERGTNISAFCSHASSLFSRYNGILHIASTGRTMTTSRAFFTSIMNQLLYAEKYNLIPWIHLDEMSSSIVYDSTMDDNDDNSNEMNNEDIIAKVVNKTDKSNFSPAVLSFPALHGMAVSVARYYYEDNIDTENIAEVPSDSNRAIYPSEPAMKERTLYLKNYTVTGKGVWNLYFTPFNSLLLQSNVLAQCPTIANKIPIIRMEEVFVVPGMESYCPWCIRSWRYDSVPGSLWWNKTANDFGRTRHQQIKNSDETATEISRKEWLEPMRIRGHKMVQKYYKFQPYIIKRANDVNPVNGGSSPSHPCLGVHIRLTNKIGKFRRIVKANEYLPYMEAFQRMGGKAIYLATDSRKAFLYISKNFPKNVTRIIRSQGKYVVRSSKDIPLHYLEDHHRVNAEVFVDILALSKCQYLLHSYSTTSEAAIYFNIALHNNSINLEEPDKLSINEFEHAVRQMLGKQSSIDTEMNETKSDGEVAGYGTNKGAPVDFIEPRVIERSSSLQTRNKCRNNAIVYLAQKHHSTYERDSFSNLLKSLYLLNKNYLAIDNHFDNTDIFIFHTGDFTSSDIDTIEKTMTAYPRGGGIIRLVDISNTSFWARPKYNANDQPESWYAWPLFSEDYRRMMHWFAIDIWDFFQWYNDSLRSSPTTDGETCQYRYIMRLDEDSYIHSPITYDIFETMLSQQYVYGFRMCAYELQVTQRMSKLWYKRHPEFVPKRQVTLSMCGFYNNFFVADLKYFWRDDVQNFLKFIDRQGHIYRRRLGDLMIHSMAVYWFAEQNQIHRFLDFTYEHGTLSNKDHQSKDVTTPKEGCLIWGGIQAGYADPRSDEAIQKYLDEMTNRGCPVNRTFLQADDLSPTYQHLIPGIQAQLSLATITAGAVEMEGQGMDSG